VATLRPVRRPLMLMLCCAALVPGACGGDDKKAAGSDAAKPASTGPCKTVSAPAPKPDGAAQRPREALAPGKTYDVEFKTSCGSFTIRVDQKTTPKAAASFVSLARSGFYDHLSFNRIVPGFVVQAGDPTETGEGGPGYTTVDRVPPNVTYTRGVVAMGKTASDPPGTAGSQFYVVTGPDAGLPPEYAVLGKVVKGLATTVAAIDGQGDPSSGDAGVPRQPVVIDKATVSAR
jgi:peptidyl-prolyl cis-trans isomerase B (cyclophilin B)